MPNWFWVLVVIVGVTAAGLLSERGRMRGLERIAAQRGFAVHAPFRPGDYPPMARLAEQFDGRPPLRWGAGLTGVADGLEIVIGEHEAPRRSINSPVSWQVVMIWRNAATHGEWAAWRLPGNLTTANFEALLVHLAGEQRHSVDSRQP